MTDKEIIDLYCKSVKLDLPDLRLTLEFAGMKKEDIDKIIENITPEQLVKLYTKNE